MKKVIVALALASLLTVPAGAEVQTYEDEYVSFQYDDEIEGRISRMTINTTLVYGFETEGTYSTLWVGLKENCSDEEPLASSGDYCATFHDGEDGESPFGQLVRETLVLADNLAVNGDDFDSIYIYFNCEYSEQTLNYARKALEICEDYLKMSLSYRDAADQMQEVEDRADKYREEMGNMGDERLHSILFLCHSHFTFEEDTKVMETRDELKELLQNAEGE